MKTPRQIQPVPPSPQVMAQLFADYLKAREVDKMSFREYLRMIGYLHTESPMAGRDCGNSYRVDRDARLVDVPQFPITGPLSMIVLLVDFSDNIGHRPRSEYAEMLFSAETFATGSLRDYYQEVSGGRVDVTGTVHGWLRMPKTYAYYVDNKSGVDGVYPRNAQKLAEDAVVVAKSQGISFPASLDKLGTSAITALFIVHAGPGAEVIRPPLQKRRIWSHKAPLASPVEVAPDLWATTYLTVPEDSRVGVCAHELGHLAFQWDDFYDPNYAEDGSQWDGSGNWDLMAGGSYNGAGHRPAHPAGLHKSQHGWVTVETIVASRTGVRIPPYDASGGKVVRVVGPRFRTTQALILENRRKQGFDADLSGEGLLVWRVDTRLKQINADHPAMYLVQADGNHELDRPEDFNTGDAGDPFPGTSVRTALDDHGAISTSFPNEGASGIAFSNIHVDAQTGDVILDISVNA